MKNIRDVPLPIWMQKLPRDKRGYPIPYIVLRDKKGNPHFTINEEHRRQEVIKNDLCAICGRGLLKRRACVGGPKAIFHPDGAVIDPPMHVECARYALEVCPYLAARNYSKRIDDKTLGKVEREEQLILVDPTMDPTRPKLFCMAIHTKQKKIMGHLGLTPYVKYIKPGRPYVAVEFWQNGKRLPNDEGLTLAKQALLDVYVDDFERIEEIIHPQS